MTTKFTPSAAVACDEFAQTIAQRAARSAGGDFVELGGELCAELLERGDDASLPLLTAAGLFCRLPADGASRFEIVTVQSRDETDMPRVAQKRTVSITRDCVMSLLLGFALELVEHARADPHAGHARRIGFH